MSEKDDKNKKIGSVIAGAIFVILCIYIMLFIVKWAWNSFMPLYGHPVLNIEQVAAMIFLSMMVMSFFIIAIRLTKED